LTALLSRDGTNFTLACDRCGHLVADLAESTRHWDLTWDEVRQRGWEGAELATGPHFCPACTQVPAPPLVTEQVPDRPRPTARRRRSNRIVVTDLPTATVVEIRGAPGVAVNAKLYELLLDRSPLRSIIVDLSRVAVLDSGALDVLVQARTHAERLGFGLCLVGLSEPMTGALRLLCLTRVLPCFAGRAEALAWLRDRSPGPVGISNHATKEVA
jgi:anti-anti-sigma factor